MNEIFSGKFAPITNTIGFLQCDIDDAVIAFLDWQRGIQEERGVSLLNTKLNGGFKSDLSSLLPLTSVESRRFIFVPTQSEWIAYLDNGHQGTDVFPPCSYIAERASCHAVRSTYIPEGYENRCAATVLEIYGPNRTEFLNIVRSIAVGFDGRKWSFSAGGKVQPFESVEKYSNRTKKTVLQEICLNPI